MIEKHFRSLAFSAPETCWSFILWWLPCEKNGFVCYHQKTSDCLALVEWKLKETFLRCLRKKTVIMLGGNDVSFHESENSNPTSSRETALKLNELAIFMEMNDFYVYAVEVILPQGPRVPIVELNQHLDYAFAERLIHMGLYYSRADYSDEYHPRKMYTRIYSGEYTRKSNSRHPRPSLKLVHFFQVYFSNYFWILLYYASLWWEQVR